MTRVLAVSPQCARHDQLSRTIPTNRPTTHVQRANSSLLAGHAGTVVGILAPGPSATPFSSAPEVSDAMAVDDAAATPTPATPALSAAAKKKEEEAKAERERKYPGPQRAGIVLAAEKKVTSKLLEKDRGSSEKIFLINGSVVVFLVSVDGTLRRLPAQQHPLRRRWLHLGRQLARQLLPERGSGALLFSTVLAPWLKA